MGALADAAAKARVEQGESRACAAGKLMRSYDATDQKVFQELMDDDSFSTRAIVGIIQRAGGRIGWDSLESHRKGMCSCGRSV